MNIISPPLTPLFGSTYFQKTLPNQSLVAKTIPVLKNMEEAHKIENYHPVANLCSTSKIFE